MFYKTSNVNDTELVYSLLKEKYPENQIYIEYNDNSKEYLLNVSSEKYVNDPTIPVDINIKVIYGDSVTGDTPLLLQKDDHVYIKTIQDMFDEKNAIQYPGFKLFEKFFGLEKEYSTSDYKIWTDKGWANIKKVIRHKTNKKIYKVASNSGFVKVTEDHSLIDENGKILKPHECNTETKLLNNYPKQFQKLTFFSQNALITNDKAYLYGYFLINGSLTNNTWCINHIHSFYCFNKLKNILKNEYPYLKFTENKYQKSLHFSYSLSINSDKIYNEFINYDKEVPMQILNSDIVTMTRYYNGYHDAVNQINGGFNKVNQIMAAGIFYLMKQLNYITTLDSNDIDNFALSYSEYNNNNDCGLIKNIELIETNGSYNTVYDIETENGRFQAGVGNLIVSNTDSIFLSMRYNRDDYHLNRKDTFKIAELCGDKLTHDIFKRPPIEMEFEKVFHPFILLSKKRYIGRKYDNMRDPFEMTKLVTSGIALTRRDYCKMVKKCYKSIIDIIMEMKDNDASVINKAIDIYKSYVEDIINYKINFDDLIVSALLAKSYKTRPVHVILAEKLKSRNEDVQIGERIPYIYIEDTSGLNKIKSELGEDPVYAKKNNLKYNRICYLEQLTKPILSFFYILLKDNESESEKLLDYINAKMTSIGGKKFRSSDFKLFAETE